MSYLFYLAVGIVAGILGGMIGAAGGVVIVPALVYLFHYTQHKAQGTSLVALLLPVGLLGAYEYWRMGNADIKVGLIISVGLFVGAYLGARIATPIPDDLLRRIFGLFFLLISVKMILGK